MEGSGFDPKNYFDEVTAEVPEYGRLQDEVSAAAAGVSSARWILDLGSGTGETARRALAVHPDASLMGIDGDPAMLDRARAAVPGGDFRVARLEDPLPDGQFDLAVSALAVHHLDGPGKADLFRRLAGRLRPAGRFVLGDVVVPDEPADSVTPVDWVEDVPSSAAEQLGWLRAAGFGAEVAWAHRDLVVLVADRR